MRRTIRGTAALGVAIFATVEAISTSETMWAAISILAFAQAATLFEKENP